MAGSSTHVAHRLLRSRHVIRNGNEERGGASPTRAVRHLNLEQSVSRGISIVNPKARAAHIRVDVSASAPKDRPSNRRIYRVRQAPVDQRDPQADLCQSQGQGRAVSDRHQRLRYLIKIQALDMGVQQGLSMRA